MMYSAKIARPPPYLSSRLPLRIAVKIVFIEA
jgi:hypothetical protein